MSGMIVAPQSADVEEGAKVLMRGGNAIDAGGFNGVADARAGGMALEV